MLVHREFDIRDGVGLVCAEIPAFTRGGRCQLDPEDVEETRQIAQLRLHVERKFGCKYTMLNETTPVSSAQ